MSKAGALAATGIGGGGAAIGGYYAFGQGGGSGEATTSAEQTQEKVAEAPLLELDTLAKFKSDGSKDKCMQEIFGTTTIDFTATTGETTTLPTEADFFKTPTTGTTKGCLTINYYKKKVEGEQDKTTGLFT